MKKISTARLDRRQSTKRHASGGGRPSFLIVVLSILFFLYFLCTIASFLSLPEIPNDLLSSPLLLQQHQIINRDREEEREYNNFPQSIEQESFETIPHPGVVAFNKLHPSKSKDVSTMNLPKFWDNASLPNEEIMSRSTALSIGSKIELNGQRLETIYAGIASYRDYQCTQTVEILFRRAKYPQRVRVGIVDQINPAIGDQPCILPRYRDGNCSPDSSILCRYRNQIDVYSMDAKLAVGPVFARHIAQRLYRGEYFSMQLDAHVDMVNDWDEDIISQWKATHNEMAVITVYPSGITNSIDDAGNRKRSGRAFMCDSEFVGQRKISFMKHGIQPEIRPKIKGTPTLQPYWAAGFSFARGHFARNVPYDEHLPWVFQGEEISVSVRGFTYGYDFYTPEKQICYHWYAHGDVRSNITLFWENQPLYQGVGRTSMMRLNGIIQMSPKDVSPEEWDHTEEQRYGLGKVRTAEKFFDLYGIHVEERKVEHRLCRFVRTEMHQKFVKFLREDGMGIDYEKIDFQWKEPES